MPQSWMIGSGLDCDLVIDLPGVSARHCRLTRDDRGYLLEDLGSTNGTFVRGRRIDVPTRIAQGDPITLGRSASMPWPLDVGASAASRTLRLGRDPDNDIIIDAPMVSGRHALVGWDEASGRGWIEDQRSANGTAIGSPGRTSGRLSFSASDVVYLGSREVPGAWLLERLGVRPESTKSAPDLPRTGQGIGREWPIAALLGQAVLLSLVIIALGGAAGPAAKSATIASLLSAAAVWFGLSSILLDGFADPDRISGGPLRADREFALRRLPSVAISCVAQCVAGWLVVAMFSGLKLPAGPTIGLLMLAATTGLALGGLIVAARPSLVATLAASLAMVVIVGLLGGATAPSRAVASIMPTRWAFEGLLLLESGAGGAVDRYFPAETARSGLTACALALGFLATGLSAASAFIAWGPGATSGPGYRPHRLPPASSGR